MKKEIKPKFRDIIAFPFLLLAILFELIAIVIGGTWISIFFFQTTKKSLEKMNNKLHTYDNQPTE